MARQIQRLTFALVLGGLAAIGAVNATAADEKPPTVSQIMKKVNDTRRGANKGLTSKINAAATDAKWDEAQKLAKELKELGVALGKNTPKKGGKDSWKELCDQYAKDTAAVADAAEKKDAKAVKAAVAAIGASCKACHNAHQ